MTGHLRPSPEHGPGQFWRRLVARALPRLFLRRFRATSDELGKIGEALAAAHLRRSGWRIRARRLRTPFGEVDIVAERAGVLACVEVKTGRLPTRLERQTDGRVSPILDLRWRPGLRLDRRGLERRQRAAREIASSARRPGRAIAWQVDLVEVLVEEPTGRVRLLHHPDLVQPLGREGR